MSTRRAAENCWIEADGGFVGAAWYWPRSGRALGTAVLIVPGIAHEERAMSSGVAALAESLADQGLPSLLIDLHGCSQSSGQLDEPDIGERWRQNIRGAARHLREAGFERLIVVGVRLGVLLAFDALRETPLLGMVGWSPVVSGRRHVRELKVLQGTADIAADSLTAGLAIGGFDIAAPVLSHVTTLDLMQLDRISARHVLMLDSTDALNTHWQTHFGTAGVAIDTAESKQTEAWLFGSSDAPTLPLEAVQTVTDWCRRIHDTNPTDSAAIATKPRLNTAVSFTHKGRRVRETLVEIGPIGLTAVLSEPADSASRPGAARLLMSTVGPGRTFTNFARDQASRGEVCLRFDFAGFGTSHYDALSKGGELYTDSGRKDVIAAVDHLRRNGYERVFALGFCAGAWSMLQAGALPAVKAAAAINVALYRQPDPSPTDFARRARRQFVTWVPGLTKSKLFRRLAARVERTSNAKRQPVKWLEALCAADIPVMLAYADVDPGLEYLNRQFEQGLGAQLPQRGLSLKTYEGLGHLAVGAAARSRVFDDVTDFFAMIDRRHELAGAASSSQTSSVRASANATVPTAAGSRVIPG